MSDETRKRICAICKTHTLINTYTLTPGQYLIVFDRPDPWYPIRQSLLICSPLCLLEYARQATMKPLPTERQERKR